MHIYDNYIPTRWGRINLCCLSSNKIDPCTFFYNKKFMCHFLFHSHCCILMDLLHFVKLAIQILKMLNMHKWSMFCLLQIHLAHYLIKILLDKCTLLKPCMEVDLNILIPIPTTFNIKK